MLGQHHEKDALWLTKLWCGDLAGVDAAGLMLQGYSKIIAALHVFGIAACGSILWAAARVVGWLAWWRSRSMSRCICVGTAVFAGSACLGFVQEEQGTGCSEEGRRQLDAQQVTGGTDLPEGAVNCEGQAGRHEQQRF